MGATVSGPSITVDETAETITLTAGATIPSRQRDVRFGSLADINRTRRLCPLSGVKQT